MPVEPPQNTKEVRTSHRFDEAQLHAYLRAELDGFGDSLVVRQFDGGQSNPTFWVSDGERAFTLRKKPPGKLLPSAHAVDREYRVISALRDTGVPVPRVHALCEDAEVIGTAFYVMEHVAGRIFWNVQLPDLERAERSALYEEFVRVLSALHAVDYQAVGLGDYGRVGGYVERQVKRWTKQYEASRTDDIPAMDRLIDYLPKNYPAASRTTIAHGDYRLDNLIWHPTEPKCLAVIDWELSTLGNPYADLAYTCMLYDIAMPNIGGLLGVDFEASGIPSEQAFVARYRELTGEGEIADWPYFKAFSLFRLAAIVQGVYKRSLDGNASNTNAGMYGAAVGMFSKVACRILGLASG